MAPGLPSPWATLGGQVVNLLAARHPERVRSVVALDPAHGAHGAEPRTARPYLRRRMEPTLIVWTSAEAATWDRGTLHVPGSRVDHWPDSGHYLHEEHPERTVRLVKDWAPRGRKIV